MLRPPSDDLIALREDAARHPGAWEFFALVRSLEQLSPEAPRIGTALDPADESVELANEPTMAFARTSIAGFDTDRRRRPRLRSHHLGLTGPHGTLPTHMTEMVMVERSTWGGTPLGDFLDLISARMLQAFYRAWASGDPCAQADRPADDRFAGCLGAVSGAVSLRFVSGVARGQHGEEGFGEWRRLAYGGHLAGLRSAAAVADLLSHALERPVAVEENVARWRDIPPDARTQIGHRGRHQRLGVGATLGRRFQAVEWDVALRVGARSMDDLDRLLPGGDVHELLVEAADAVLPDHVEWHARIEIDEARIAPARLGMARLGLTGWLSLRGADRLRNDVRLTRRTGNMTADRGARK